MAGTLAALIVGTQLGGCANMPEAFVKAKEDFRDFYQRMKAIAVGPGSDTQIATRAEAEKKFGYDSKQGERLEMESATVTPQSVSPGDTLESSVRFTALAPDSAKKIRLTETRTVTVEGEPIQLGQQRHWEVAQGTPKSNVKLTMPNDMPKGSYTLVTTISDGKNTSVVRSMFSVV
jgi:hypothetical protein